MNIPYNLQANFKRGMCLSFLMDFLDIRLTHIHFIYVQEDLFIHDIFPLTQ